MGVGFHPPLPLGGGREEASSPLFVHYAGLYPARPSVLRLPSVGLQTPDSGLPAPSGLSCPTAPIGLIGLIGPIVLTVLTVLTVTKVLRDLTDLTDLRDLTDPTKKQKEK